MNLNQPKIDIILGTLVLINPIKPKFKRRHSSRDYNLWVKVDGHDSGHFHRLIWHIWYVDLAKLRDWLHLLMMTVDFYRNAQSKGRSKTNIILFKLNHNRGYV